MNIKVVLCRGPQSALGVVASTFYSGYVTHLRYSLHEQQDLWVPCEGPQSALDVGASTFYSGYVTRLRYLLHE